MAFPKLKFRPFVSPPLMLIQNKIPTFRVMSIECVSYYGLFCVDRTLPCGQEIITPITASNAVDPNVLCSYLFSLELRGYNHVFGTYLITDLESGWLPVTKYVAHNDSYEFKVNDSSKVKELSVVERDIMLRALKVSSGGNICVDTIM